MKIVVDESYKQIQQRSNQLAPKQLSHKYEDERAELKQQIMHQKAVVAEEQRHEMNDEGFLQFFRQYIDIQELTPEILHNFIDKMVAHHREKRFGEMEQ